MLRLPSLALQWFFRTLLGVDALPPKTPLVSPLENSCRGGGPCSPGTSRSRTSRLVDLPPRRGCGLQAPAPKESNMIHQIGNSASFQLVVWIGGLLVFQGVSHVPSTRTSDSNPNPNHQYKPPSKGYLKTTCFWLSRNQRPSKCWGYVACQRRKPSNRFPCTSVPRSAEASADTTWPPTCKAGSNFFK